MTQKKHGNSQGSGYELYEPYEFNPANLEFCENGKLIENNLKIACSDAMNLSGFSKWITNITSKTDLSYSSQMRILFTVIQSGNVDKLKTLRNLVCYDQIPLNFQDEVTKETTVSISRSIEMKYYVDEIIRRQRVELKGGAELLLKNGVFRYASGIKISSSLDKDSPLYQEAIELEERDAELTEEFSKLISQLSTNSL
jgi:hypothetical protein